MFRYCMPRGTLFCFKNCCRAIGTAQSLAVNKQRKGVGKNCWARTRVLRGCRGSRAEFRRNQIDGVSSIIQSHGAGAALRLDHFDEGEFSWGILMRDGERAISAGSKGKTSDRVETVGVDALADGDGAEDFAGIAVNERHQLVVAAYNEYFVRSINGQSGGRFARRKWPGIFNLESIGVEFDQGTLVFQIDENLALAV